MNPTMILGQAMRLAFTLGKTYWRQADSESICQQNKAAETQVRFNTLLKETLDAANLAERAAGVPDWWTTKDGSPPISSRERVRMISLGYPADNVASWYSVPLFEQPAQPSKAQSDEELRGMWSASDFTGGDLDERSYSEREKDSSAETLHAITLARLLQSVRTRSYLMDKADLLTEFAELHAMVLAIQASRPKDFPLSDLELDAAVFINRHHAEIEEMAEQVGVLRYLAASMYQAAGAYSLPVRFLDVLSAAGNGDPITWNQVAAILPCETPMFDELDNAIDAAMLDNKQETI